MALPKRLPFETIGEPIAHPSRRLREYKRLGYPDKCGNERAVTIESQLKF